MVEYKVRPVIRYVVTYFENNERGCVSGVVGEFDNEHAATVVSNVLGESQKSFMPTSEIPQMPA